MIIIDNKIVEEDIIKSHFACQLSSCKGMCCSAGDWGAPLEEKEIAILDDIYENIRPFLRPEGIEAIEKQGKHVWDEENRIPATTLIEGKDCAYSIIENGVFLCGIEKAYRAGATHFKKPISCYLYPIRIDFENGFEHLRYDRWDICSSGCTNGKKEKIRLYEFLKQPIIDKYGQQFYDQLEATANHVLKK